MVNNKLIAKNTVFMYLRLMVTIPLAFYTSRIVLQQLGIDDYGIYQAVAGMITMFTILRSAFDSATQRYYNAAIAANDERLLSKMYSTSLCIHVGISVLLVLIIELFGLWFISNKMHYPHGSEKSVFFVFHTMVFSVVFIVMNVPFTGMIIAKEHMKFYAYLSVYDIIVKLILVLLLFYVNGNKLHIYSVMQMCMSLMVFVINVTYFKFNFKEVHFSKLSRGLLKEMSAFSGWAILGNICYSLVHEGVNLLLNVFGGVVANAARGIVFQVRGVISNVLTTTIMPVRPQATQLFINQDYNSFLNLIYLYSKILFILSSFIVIPIIFYTENILKLWLGVIPEYSIVFLQIIMIYTLIRSFHEPLDIAYKASGRMKVYQLTTISISSLTFFGGWLALYMGMPIYSPFVIFTVIETLLLIALVIAAREERIKVSIYWKKILFPCLLYTIPAMSGCYCIKIALNEHLWFLGLLLSVLFLICMSVFIVLNSGERKVIKLRVLHR